MLFAVAVAVAVVGVVVGVVEPATAADNLASWSESGERPATRTLCWLTVRWLNFGGCGRRVAE